MADGRRILKFVLQPGVTDIETEDRPRFLAVGAQGDDVVVWAEATAGAGVNSRLASVMTGQGVPPFGEYVGTTTLTLPMGPIVVHVYVGPS